MEVQNVLHMNGGEQNYSYLKNSFFQKKVITTAKPIVQECIAELCKNCSSKCLTMADMGCSAGPNTLLPLREIIEAIDSTCSSLNKKAPNLLYFLNDLPGNDFNIIFRSFVPDFYQKLADEKCQKFGDCYIAAIPGSFYGSLFPPNSLQFVHSSFSVHWISQVPEGVINESGHSLNKGNICLVETSPKSVHKAYEKQFAKDFTKFLRSRSVEMIAGGYMVITIIIQDHKNPYPDIYQFLGDSLKEMVTEGIIEESRFENFNMAYYTPYIEQMRNLIQEESSFSIKEIKEIEARWDATIGDGNDNLVFNKWERGRYVANYIRAITEPQLKAQFGDGIDIDNLFDRYSLKVVDCLEKGIAMLRYVVMSMIKKYKFGSGPGAAPGRG